MLNAWAYLGRIADQWSIHPADPRNLYTSKQTSFSYVTKSFNITFEQSLTRAVGSFNFVWL